MTGSLALLSDAGHMLADAGALALALVAQRVASQPRTELRTYGFRRAETLAAFLNGITLGVTAVWIIVEAAERWQAPPAIDGRTLVLIAGIGLVVNVAAAWVLACVFVRERSPLRPTGLCSQTAAALRSMR